MKPRVQRLLIGMVVVSIVAVILLRTVIRLAFVTLELAIGLIITIFCIYILYVFWGALMELFRRRGE